jgi:hypothetical protein
MVFALFLFKSDETESLKFSRIVLKYQQQKNLEIISNIRSLFSVYSVGSEEGGWSDVFWFHTMKGNN